MNPPPSNPPYLPYQEYPFKEMFQLSKCALAT